MPADLEMNINVIAFNIILCSKLMKVVQRSTSGGQWPAYLTKSIHHIDGLVQERCKSIANALELRLSCTNP